MFRAFGVPVFDADAQVHALFAPGGAAVAPVAAAFPGCLARPAGSTAAGWAAMVLGRPDELRRLEAIVHPLVRAGRGAVPAPGLPGGRQPGACSTFRCCSRPAARRRVDAVAVVCGQPDAAGASAPCAGPA